MSIRLSPPYRTAAIVAALLGAMSNLAAAQPSLVPSDYRSLVDLFQQWRAAERPATRDGVPDYTVAAMDAKVAALPAWYARLAAIDTVGWPTAQQIDYKLVRAEMDGEDFNLRVLRPWARDPAFYVSVWANRTDVPSREAPVSQPEIQLYDYRYPLTAEAQRELTARMTVIPALLTQARASLQASNARDLWVYGEQLLRSQLRALTALENGTLTVSTLEGSQHADLTGATPALRTAVGNARQATEAFISWLAKEAPSKSGPSGVGRIGAPCSAISPSGSPCSCSRTTTTGSTWHGCATSRTPAPSGAPSPSPTSGTRVQRVSRPRSRRY